MAITIKFHEVIEKRLFQILHVNTYKDVLDMNYQSDGDIDKEKTKIYQKLMRGSIRLINGRFRTLDEKRQRIEEFKKLKLQ